MIQVDTSLADLYEADETAWLDAMAERIRHGTYSELDYAHLEEYLSDMAGSDRRKVENRLVVLMVHILKWTYQPKKRTNSWRGTLIEQRRKLSKLVRGVLRTHAESVLAEAYKDAVEQAAAVTGVPLDKFPPECPFSLDYLLYNDPTATEN